MTTRDLVVASNNDAATALYHAFITGFEGAFRVNGNGTLCANRECRHLTTWFNEHRIMIMLITGVDVPPLEFETPTRGDIGTTNENKQKLLHYYALSYTAYIKYCQTLNREISRRYLPVLQPDIVELQE